MLFAVFLNTVGLSSSTAAQVAAAATSGGYVVEIAVPRAQIGTAGLEPRRLIGFNFSVIDDDLADGESKPWDARTSWLDRITYQANADWGQVRLSAIEARSPQMAGTATPTFTPSPTTTPTVTNTPFPTRTPTPTPLPGVTPTPTPGQWPQQGFAAQRTSYGEMTGIIAQQRCSSHNRRVPNHRQ